MPPKLRTRKPTGAPSWPLILVAGEAKTGKTYLAALLTGDKRVGRCFWLDLGEGCADEYGAVPGANYEIIEHDGTWIQIIEQVEAVRDIARATLTKGEPPVVLVIDSMTAEWAMLSAWTDARARRSTNNRKMLATDPDAEIDITSNYWNDANSRHNRLMNMLKTFPGIVVMTALESEKTQFGPDGRPVKGAPKVARPDAQKKLSADATVWIRLSLEHDPVIMGIRSIRHNIRPGKDRPKPWPDFTLGALIFDFLEIGHKEHATQVRDMPTLNADQVMPDEVVEHPEKSTPPVAPNLGRAVEFVMSAPDADEATARMARLTQRPEAEAEVAKLLSEPDRETLGLREDETVKLLDLAAKVVEYCERHKVGPRVVEPAAA